MATLADAVPAPETRRPDRFFLYGGLALVAVMVAGFSLHLAAGRSSFDAQWYIHVHGVIFFGWVTLFAAQTILATSNNMALHKRLGWVAALWVPLMLIFGMIIFYQAVRSGRAAPVYLPSFFVFMAPLSLLTFAGLTAAAITMRRRPEWHKRLHFCGMAMISGPGWGRLMPMPLLIPWTGTAEFAASMLVPVIGMAVDWRREGRVHPAWWVGIGAMVAMRMLAQLLALTPLAPWLFGIITDGAPGAIIDPYNYPILQLPGPPS